MKEHHITLGLIALVLIVIAGAMGLYSYALKTQPVLTEINIDSQNKQFVADGNKLSHVEVWLIPTGTNITAADYTKISDFTRKGEEWVAPIPAQPFLATEIFVKAFDKNNREVGRKSYPYSGATEIYNAFSQFWLQK